jgi:hypothetical protein
LMTMTLSVLVAFRRRHAGNRPVLQTRERPLVSCAYSQISTIVAGDINQIESF